MIKSLRALCTIALMAFVGVNTADAQVTGTPGQGKFTLVKNNDEVVVGGRYIIVGSATNRAMKAYVSGSNNYGNVKVTLNETKDVATITDATTAVFTLSSGKYGFYFLETNNNTYLAISKGNSNNNYLKAEKTASGLTGTTINIEEDGNAFIQFKGNLNTYTHNVLRYNNTSGVFACYEKTNTNQNPVRLYREVYTRDVTPGKYGTLCLPYSGTISGAKLFTIEGKQMEDGVVTSISLVEAEKVEAGVPYIFLATGNVLEVKYTGLKADATESNGLVGSYAGTGVDEGMYVISNNQVMKCGTGSQIGDNRCYINMEKVTGQTPSAGARILRFETPADGIESVEQAKRSHPAYDLSGRRVNGSRKGLCIVNGKKIIR